MNAPDGFSATSLAAERQRLLDDFRRVRAVTIGLAEPLSPEDCQAQSGEVVHDQGCPSGRTQLGMVGPGGEGGICCSMSGAAPAEQPTGKRSPCTFGADQTCNEDPKVSALWGKCTETGVCVCNPGFELSPGGYCRPAS